MNKLRLFKNKPKNWILKVISLILAVMLWYFVVGEDQVDINIKIPIEILNLPSNLTISNQYKKDIEVSVRGPRSIIQELRTRNISRPVDLSSAQTGTIVIKNDDESIPFPRGITVQRLQPTNITLLIDQLIEKVFPINPVTEGELSAGYELQKIYLDPDKLVISGPKAILEKNLALKTYVINLDGLDHSTTLQVHLDLEPDLFDLIGETVVTAKLVVQEKMVKRTIKNIPINLKESSFPVTIQPDTITVIADITQNLIKDTPELSMLFRAFIAPKNVPAPQKMVVTVNGVNVPGHQPLKIISITPREVLVTPVDTVILPE